MKYNADTGKRIAKLATKALKQEAELSPKPGLVDSFDNGSHSDMDIELFRVSAQAFEKSFLEYINCGYEHLGDSKSLLGKLRDIGKTAETTMFSATKGINTHKGANFTFGLVLAALGQWFAKAEQDSSSFENETVLELFETIKTLTADIIQNDFKGLADKKNLTYGERLYLDHGIGGIRKEAALGYPTIVNIALPRLLELRESQLSSKQIYLEILFLLMASTTDSNLVSRGGIKGLEYAQKTAKEFLETGGVANQDYEERIRVINSEFISKNLSPGGSADLLSVVIFLDLLLKELG